METYPSYRRALSLTIVTFTKHFTSRTHDVRFGVSTIVRGQNSWYVSNEHFRLAGAYSNP